MKTSHPDQPPQRLQTVFHPEFREDLRYWVNNDRKTALKLLPLIEAIARDPYKGTGKPQPPKYLAADLWSRRLTREHRVVYLVKDQRIEFLQCRYHYE